MARKKLLFDPSSATLRAKRVIASDDPRDFEPAFSALGNTILSLLAKGPAYPSAIAKSLGRYHQTVYYHMHGLEKAGLIRRVGRREIRGGVANLYALTADGYAVEFDVEGEALPSLATGSRSPALGRFFREFTAGGEFSGFVVVGSPEPHGPNGTQGRDGHYAIQLGFALGQFVRLPRVFPVKLDVDLKNEKLERSNLIVIGGPRTNMVAAELNPHLPIRFSDESFWGSIVDDRKRRYLSELDSVVVKAKNPWDGSKTCVLAAGLTGAATKAAVIALTSMADQLLDSSGEVEEFAAVLRGADLDGDGKVDSAEVLHRM